MSLVKITTRKSLNLQEIEALKTNLANMFGEVSIDYSDLISLNLDKTAKINDINQEIEVNPNFNTKATKTKTTKNPKIQETTRKLKEFWAKQDFENQNYTPTQSEIDSLTY
jgi:hypothetical protein